MPRLDNNGRPIKEFTGNEQFVIARVDPDTKLVLGFVSHVGYHSIDHPLWTKLRSGQRLKKFGQFEADFYIKHLESSSLFPEKEYQYKKILARHYQKEI